jgi:hypothetical protein
LAAEDTIAGDSILDGVRAAEKACCSAPTSIENPFVSSIIGLYLPYQICYSYVLAFFDPDNLLIV